MVCPGSVPGYNPQKESKLALYQLVPTLSPLRRYLTFRRAGGYLANDVKRARIRAFLQVGGHSVPAAAQEKSIDAIATFFALPLEENEKLSQSNSERHRGYERIGGQKLDKLDDDDATTDQKEGKDSATVHSLSKAKFQLIALSLSLPRHFFDRFASDPNGICLPLSPLPDGAGRTRGGSVGDLEVLHKPTSTWHGMPPVEGAYVCNSGDLIQRWTHDRYRSTLHRVLSPRTRRDRYSCAFFNDGALDMIIYACDIGTCFMDEKESAMLRTPDRANNCTPSVRKTKLLKVCNGAREFLLSRVTLVSASDEVVRAHILYGVTVMGITLEELNRGVGVAAIASWMEGHEGQVCSGYY
ncbi:Clavaminate synthase-like protein [Byssothecium circinans]|uniref:Clavaminate synthase-like protein n=1 Tax=Byssothecium circinans TaxID=147558 RepID=A0A6A5UDF9_9PLEO|nr:Clavaminate synthase-like protein [Byssothecium circinans]